MPEIGVPRICRGHIRIDPDRSRNVIRAGDKFLKDT